MTTFSFPKDFLSLPTSELAWCWVAGFLEGEGSFIHLQDGGLRISATQKDRESLDRLQEICGGKVYINGTRDMHFWYLERKEPAEKLMRLLRPMMTERRQKQIDDALANFTPLSTTESQTHCFHGHRKRDNAKGYSKRCVECRRYKKRLNFARSIARNFVLAESG